MLFMVVAMLVGCQPHGCFLRRQAAAPPTAVEHLTDAGEGAHPEDVTTDLAQHAKGFFRSDRSPGGWSSEAAAIEADLGVK